MTTEHDNGGHGQGGAGGEHSNGHDSARHSCSGHVGADDEHGGHGENGRETEEPKKTLLEQGQKCLMSADPAGAVKLLQAELDNGKGDSIDVHLLLAEALWQQAGKAGTDKALPHYEKAAECARSEGNSSKEGMILLGHGFALTQLGKAPDARRTLLQAKTLIEATENKQAAAFAQRLLDQVGEQAVTEEEIMQSTWKQFAESMAAEQKALLFLRGTVNAPLDERSQHGVTKLRAVGCSKLTVVDVCAKSADVPVGLHGVGSAHLEFPQLFVGASELHGWLDLPDTELREKLEGAGVSLSDPVKEEPCHGAAAFADGLEPWEVALVELVSQEAAGDWEGKAQKLAEKGLSSEDQPLDAGACEVAWKRLAPLVKEKLETQPEMPCGHTCNACPTRHDCHLHDELAGADLEDLGEKMTQPKEELPSVMKKTKVPKETDV